MTLDRVSKKRPKTFQQNQTPTSDNHNISLSLLSTQLKCDDKVSFIKEAISEQKIYSIGILIDQEHLKRTLIKNNDILIYSVENLEKTYDKRRIN